MVPLSVIDCGASFRSKPSLLRFELLKLVKHLIFLSLQECDFLVKVSKHFLVSKAALLLTIMWLFLGAIHLGATLWTSCCISLLIGYDYIIECAASDELINTADALNRGFSCR